MHNLPAEPNSFVGREKELAELAALLARQRLVTLSGAGGIGKTRLARRIAATVEERFDHGVWFVSLAELPDPRLLPQAVAAALGLAEEPGVRPADTLYAALRPRDLLLVLDNCEHLVEDCAHFAERLLGSCPRVRILTTSREPLRIEGETVRRVRPLDPETEAVRLFTERAEAVRPGFVASAAVLRLATGLDCLPLALELAAAQVAFLSPEQIADRLGQRFGLLVQGSRTSARQRTLRAAVDWSHDLLTEEERAAFRRLSVFTGGWGVEAAETVCGSLAPLRELVAKSLVTVEEAAGGPPRYRMLETIRQYAAERLAEAGEAAEFAGRHSRYCLETAERHDWTGWRDPSADWPDRMAAFHAVAADEDNHRSALDRALRAGDAGTGLRLATALRWSWFIQGRLAEGTALLESFLALPGGEGPRDEAAVALAELLNEQGDLARAADLAATVDSPEARCLRARIGLRRGEDVEAELVAVERTADPWTRATALTARASLAFRQGRLRAAARLHRESLAILRELRHYGMAASVLMSLGLVARAEGDPARAQRLFEEALEVIVPVEGFRGQRARCLAGLGALALASGDVGRARRYLTESLTICDRTGQRLDLARALESWAALAAHTGDHPRTVRLAAAAGTVRASTGVPPSPSAGARLERLLAPARQSLGGPVLTHLWSEGSLLTPAEAVAYALGDPAPDDGPPPAPTSAPSLLTPREREIAALVEKGLTNREIAAELFISPGTAGRHLANILAKLGHTSRTQIAVWSAAQRPEDAG